MSLEVSLDNDLKIKLTPQNYYSDTGNFTSQNSGEGYVFKAPLETVVYKLKPEVFIKTLFRSSSLSKTCTLHMKM